MMDRVVLGHVVESQRLRKRRSLYKVANQPQHLANGGKHSILQNGFDLPVSLYLNNKLCRIGGVRERDFTAFWVFDNEAGALALGTKLDDDLDARELWTKI